MIGRTDILPAFFCGSNVVDFTRNRQVIQVYSSLTRSSDLKIANQNNNLLTTMIMDNLTTIYCRLVEAICIPMITRFDRLIFVFRDMEGDIMQLNGEFELQLTIEDVYDQMPSSIPQMNQFIMIEVIGNTTKKEVKLLSIIRSVFYLVRVTLYRFRVAQRINRSSGSDQCWQHTTGSVNTSRCL